MREYTATILHDSDGSQILVFPEDFKFPEGVKEVYMTEEDDKIRISCVSKIKRNVVNC